MMKDNIQVNVIRRSNLYFLIYILNSSHLNRINQINSKFKAMSNLITIFYFTHFGISKLNSLLMSFRLIISTIFSLSTFLYFKTSQQTMSQCMFNQNLSIGQKCIYFNISTFLYIYIKNIFPMEVDISRFHCNTCSIKYV